MIPLYKNKCDPKNYYRSIKLLTHTMKVWERVVEMRIRGFLFPRTSPLSCQDDRLQPVGGLVEIGRAV